MLVLTRTCGQRIMIGDDIIVTFIEHRSDRSIRLGISAPQHIEIHREEIYDKIKRGLCRYCGMVPPDHAVTCSPWGEKGTR